MRHAPALILAAIIGVGFACRARTPQPVPPPAPTGAAAFALSSIGASVHGAFQRALARRVNHVDNDDERLGYLSTVARAFSDATLLHDQQLQTWTPGTPLPAMETGGARIALEELATGVHQLHADPPGWTTRRDLWGTIAAAARDFGHVQVRRALQDRCFPPLVPPAPIRR